LTKTFYIYDISPVMADVTKTSDDIEKPSCWSKIKSALLTLLDFSVIIVMVRFSLLHFYNYS
jgi:hypothetical protein